MGNGICISWFALLVPVAFALPIKLSLSHPMSFLNFTLLVLSLITLWGVTEWLCGAELTAGVKP